MISSPTPTVPNLPSIATVLVPAERARVDAAGEGLYRAYHRDSLDDVVRDLKEQRVSAVLVSVARCGDREATQVAGLVREFPRVPAVALLTQLVPATPHAVLTLGQSGVRTLIDVRQPNGWRELRETLLAERSSDIGRVALAQLVLDLVGSPDDCWRFFEALFTSPTRVTTVRQLARRLQVLPTTLMSRFFRADLPAPKRYLAMARLVRAARVLENPGLSIADVSNHLDYSSPQSFGRHVRTMLSLTAVEFRQRYDGERMVRRFREELVLPYRETLRAFTPLTNRARWSSSARQKVA
jgi:AraC-like DNA-binding protein